LLIFPLYPNFYIAIFFVFPAAPSIFIQILIIILLFEQLLKVLSLVDRGWEVGKRVTQVQRVATIVEDQFTDETGQHLVFVVFSLLDLHNVI
jgi:hypothetical protein